jgi:hypothetical protein
MQVNGYGLATGGWDGGDAPRAWRISTGDGVFWLVEDGAVARLVRLPLHGDGEDWVPVPDAGPWAALIELAGTAEAEAAGRWVRGGRVPPVEDHQVDDIADDQP